MTGIFANYANKYYEANYNVIPLQPQTKIPVIMNWQQWCETTPMSYQFENWIHSYPDHNIGLALGSGSGIVAVDFDVDIDGLHEKVQELLQGSLVKKKGEKGFTAFYQYNGERTKRWRKDGQTVVELLSIGTQTVVPPSIHPDTKKPYTWLTEDTLFDVTAAELTPLPINFIEQVDKLFGYEDKILNFENKYSGELPELADIEKALSFIPSNDYATWISVGMALQHNYGDAGYSAWDTWSRKAPNYSDKGMQYKWNSFGRYSGNPVSIGTIFHYAVGYGYIIPHEPEFILPVDFSIIHNGVDLRTGERVDDVNDESLKDMDVAQLSQSLEFPKHLLDNAPGLPGEIAAWINSTSLMRQPILALGSAICAAGTIFAHRVASDSNLRTNFMVLGLAESATGKNHARNCIKSLFFNAGMENLTIGKAASDTGLINRLYDNNSVGISLMDEIGRELQSLTSRGVASHESRILTMLMEIYSEAGTYYDGKCYANAENSKKLIQPLLNLYATSVPKRFFDAMSSDEAIDGFLARWLIFQSHDIDPPTQEHTSINNVPEGLLANVMYVRNMPIRPINSNTGSGYTVEMPTPEPAIIPYTDGAASILREFSKNCNANRLAEIKKGGLLAPIWGRTREHAIKLALVAHPYRDGIIETITMQWACEMALYLSQVSIKAIEDNVSDSEHEKTLNRITNIIRGYNGRNNGAYMPHSILCNHVRFIKGRERNEILQQLVESGIIDVLAIDGKNGQKSNSYKVI